MSARVSTSAPSDMNCSGLMYAGVPSAMPVAVSRALSAVGAIAFAMPKSMTLHSASPSLCATTTFDGLISR